MHGFQQKEIWTLMTQYCFNEPHWRLFPIPGPSWGLCYSSFCLLAAHGLAGSSELLLPEAVGAFCPSTPTWGRALTSTINQPAASLNEKQHWHVHDKHVYKCSPESGNIARRQQYFFLCFSSRNKYGQYSFIMGKQGVQAGICCLSSSL